MKKYKFIGLTKYAKRHICVEDTESLTEMIGCEVTESDKPSIVDGKMMFIMPDGEETHIDYLELEQIQDELPFNYNKTMKKVHFRIIELTTHQVLISKDFDNESDQDTYLIDISFFTENGKSTTRLSYELEEKRNEMFDKITPEQVQKTLNSALTIFK